MKKENNNNDNMAIKATRLTKSAKTRKRNADTSKIKAYAICVCVCLFAMSFVLINTVSKERPFEIAILDNAGDIHEAKIVPFGDAKVYHNHLKEMAISGLYALDYKGPMNNNLQIVATPNVIKKRDSAFEQISGVFRNKKIVQYPRVIAYKVDVASNQRMLMKVKLQVIREAFTLGDTGIKGVENYNVILEFTKNESLEDNFYRPWVLSKYSEKLTE